MSSVIIILFFIVALATLLIWTSEGGVGDSLLLTYAFLVAALTMLLLAAIYPW